MLARRLQTHGRCMGAAKSHTSAGPCGRCRQWPKPLVVSAARGDQTVLPMTSAATAAPSPPITSTTTTVSTTARTVAAVPTTIINPTTLAEPQVSSFARHEPMSWTKQWWPLAVEDSLNPSAPNKITLLGKDLVLERTADGTWSCYSDDREPDKLHPVRSAQGLLWVWGESGTAAAEEAAATAMKADPGVEDHDRWIHRFGWLDREAPVSYEYALENFFDVAHGPFTHDGMFGISAANNNPDLPTKVERTSTQLKFVTAPSEVPRADGTTLGPAIQMSLQFPVLAAAENYVADAAGERIQDVLKFVVYRTPVRPGVNKAFYNMLLSTKMDVKMRKALMSSPAWDLHTKMLRFFDGDIVLIHDQERLVASKGGWKRAMFMPHPSDKGVAQFRAWFDQAGPIPYSGDTTLGPIQPRHVILNHWEQHCKTCKTCQQGVKLLRTLEYGCYLAAGVIGIISLAAAQLTPAGYTAIEVAAFLAPYLGLAAAVGLVVAATKVKQYVQESFYFKDYVQSRSGH